jgi:hypothetical protein
MPKFKEEIESQLAKWIVDGEYRTSELNQSSRSDDFQSMMDLIDAERSDKDYDWMSDVSLNEFASQMNTQSSIDVAQYFQTRDFTEVYIQDESDEAIAAATATKELLNRTLNQRHLYHYLKYVRAKNLNNISGRVYLECRWEQELEPQITGYDEEEVPLLGPDDNPIDVFGNNIVDETAQRPATEIVRNEIVEMMPKIDRFNYDIHDQRNVFTDNSYAYSLQQKKYVIIREEVTLQDLYDNQERAGYFNLDIIEDIIKPNETLPETETAKSSYNIDDKYQYFNNQNFDILRRYGKFWCKIDKRDDITGEPLEVSPGITNFGEVKEGAELHEVVITFALIRSQKILISFHLTPYLDARNIPYRPIIRGLCYIHGVKDDGVGDGTYAKELQIAIDDTFNMSQDRVTLATLPVFTGRRQLAEELGGSIYMEPEHIIIRDDPEDLKELEISDNIQGALQQLGVLSSKMQQATAIYPTTMGDIPGLASTTATAVAGAENRTNVRTNYKSMTFEYTALVELYWMIQQMTYRFAHKQTGFELMGDKLYDFNPSLDYYYKPLSQAIESEQSKVAKLRIWQQILMIVTKINHPDTVKMINYVFNKMCEYLGDEQVNFAQAFLNPQIAAQPMSAAGGATNPEEGAVMPASNEYGIAQSFGEQGAREGAYG